MENKMKELLQKTLTYEEYCLIPTVPFNRDIENRIKKASKKFKKLIPEHRVVTIGVLIEDSVYHGKTYKKGTEFVVDSNTRKHFWEEGMLEKPTELAATFRYYDSMDAMWEGYNTFDSVTSTESTAEKLTGQALLLGLEFYSTKIKRGTYVTALNFAAHAMYPEKFSKPSSGQNSNVEKLTLFKEELLTLDGFDLGQKVNQAVLGAFLMALKCHKEKGTDDKVIEFIKKFEDGYSDCTSKDLDGVTRAVEEIYKQQPGHFTWGTKHKEMPPQLSFVLQNIDHYVEGTTTTKYVAKPATKDAIGENYYSSYSRKHGYTALSQFLSAA
jgi:hypothetical protein